MEFLFHDGARETEHVLTVTDPTAQISDLAEALGQNPAALVIDGRLVAGSVGLQASGLVTGSTVEPAPAVAHTRPERPPLEARVVAGLDAGARVPLLQGETSIGRETVPHGIRIDHPSVSRQHGVVTVPEAGPATVADAGSRNGVDVNGVLITKATTVAEHDVIGVGGGALVRVVTPPDDRRRARVDTVHGVRHGWLVPFPRQAREALPAPVPLEPPTPPERPGRSPFLFTSLLAPIGLAVVTVWLFRDPRFAAFAVLTPIAYLASTLEERLRGRGGRRTGKLGYRTALQAFEAAVEREHRAELVRRRTEGLDPAEVAFRAQMPGACLWERRATSDDFLKLAVGMGDQPWQPQLSGDRSRQDAMPDEAAEVLARFGELPRVPVVVDLGAHRVLGVEGQRDAALAAVRMLLCQAAVAAGPADMAVAVFSNSAWSARWEWAKWLPHLFDRAQGTTRMVAVGRAESDTLAAEFLANHPFPEAEQGVLLVVVDGAGLLEGRNCPLRDLLTQRTGATRAIILADPLPALCQVALTVKASGSGELRYAASGERHGNMLVAGVSEERARATARALARFEDPEIALAGAGLPEQTPLLPLLDLPDLKTEALAERWRAGARTLRARAVLGVTDGGRYEVDLDDDGPHALIAGTTGSGKSELLRTLIAALATGNDPDHLVFVLIDYKGGGALDECARLPHVVGLVTDLDEQLSMRALRCLEAELRHRERMLRAAGLSDFRSYQQLRDNTRPDLEAMPRMVVVIDEFATLVKALPTFVDALVDVAQRGRTLGVHLVMATQRPAGSVSDAIKANVKLRIALRLETAEDSRDVLDSPAAATIGPRQWGRAFRRVSNGEVEAVQTALATTVTATGAVHERLRLAPFGFGRGVPDQPRAEKPLAETDRTDLQRLVDLACDTFAAGGHAVPRTPWPDPLPHRLPLGELPVHAETGLQTLTTALPAFVLADDPDHQRQLPLGWDPDAGNLLVFGAVGSGTTTTLATLVLAWTRVLSPDRLHVHVLDHGAGDLAPLSQLPHTGGYVRSSDRERMIRLIGLLTKELEHRKAGGGTGFPRWLVVVDGLGALLTGGDDQVLDGLMTRLAQVYAEGPAVGIALVGTVDRAGGIPGNWLARTAQKLVLRLADPSDYSAFNIPVREVPAGSPGCGLVAATRQVVQVAAPGADLARDVAEICHAWPGTYEVPTIGALPPIVPLATLEATPRATTHPWTIPIGVAQETLAPVHLAIHEHDHVLIAGPRRSGRSTLLATVATGLLKAVDAPIFAYAPRNSPIRQLPPPVRLVADISELAALVEENERPPAVLIDDADAFEDFSGLFVALTTHQDPGIHVIAVARNEGEVRSGMHWLANVRRSRSGVLLMPDMLDGELLGTNLPRRPALAMRPGRGYLVTDGSFNAIQGAVPEAALPEERS
ncbi:FtsK/SpoIIIE domain-containing protein [Streptomyces sp. YGL11-2]|uniref:FtsK/SpoIIIE domain-containing protein n=1 Tax=Streptomyces sp. YGL11-2 TaxID=3414028 RepID=UPI003CF12FB2